MSSLITSLKSEITRVARKELKGELQSLRKIATAHRSEIAALKRQLRTLTSELRAVQRTQRQAPAGSSRDEGPTPPIRIRFTAERFAAQRSKLGLTQTQMAKLCEASSLSIHKWESGAAQPRAAQLVKIAAAMKLGKREAAALL